MWRQLGSNRLWTSTSKWSLKQPLPLSSGPAMSPPFRYRNSCWFSRTTTAHCSLSTTATTLPAPLQLIQRHGSNPTFTPPSSLLLYSRLLMWNVVGCHGGTATSGTNVSIRYQHSSTQIKRLFRQHPARLRVEARMGIVRRGTPNESHHATLNHVQPQHDTDIPTKSLYRPLPTALTFAPIWTPTFLPNGWSAPPPPDSEVAALVAATYPFAVRRTKNKPKDAVGFLPVYTKHRYVYFF
jgi:hypothetical protein